MVYGVCIHHYWEFLRYKSTCVQVSTLLSAPEFGSQAAVQ